MRDECLSDWLQEVMCIALVATGATSCSPFTAYHQAVNYFKNINGTIAKWCSLVSTVVPPSTLEQLKSYMGFCYQSVYDDPSGSQPYAKVTSVGPAKKGSSAQVSRVFTNSTMAVAQPAQPYNLPLSAQPNPVFYRANQPPTSQYVIPSNTTIHPTLPAQQQCPPITHYIQPDVIMHPNLPAEQVPRPGSNNLPNYHMSVQHRLTNYTTEQPLTISQNIPPHTTYPNMPIQQFSGPLPTHQLALSPSYALPAQQINYAMQSLPTIPQKVSSHTTCPITSTGVSAPAQPSPASTTVSVSTSSTPEDDDGCVILQRINGKKICVYGKGKESYALIEDLQKTYFPRVDITKFVTDLRLAQSNIILPISAEVSEAFKRHYEMEDHEQFEVDGMLEVDKISVVISSMTEGMKSDSASKLAKLITSTIS